MKNDALNIITRVLDIIGYTDDKEKFGTDFLNLCRQQAIINLLDSVPDQQRSVLIKNLSAKKKPDEIEKVLEDYFDKKQQNKALEKAVENGFKDYINELEPNLSDEIKLKLREYLQSTYN